MLTPGHIRDRARSLGFDMIGCVPIGEAPTAQAFFEWIHAGMHGEMAYLAREPDKRADPRRVLPAARTVVIAGVSYDTLAVPMDTLRDPARGRIARYAWGADYHDVIAPRLRALGESLAADSRAYVDTGPVLERAWAAAAGLGFIGKNTCLIHRGRGSYLFLGAVFLADDLTDSDRPDRPDRPTCGACTRCLEACPTDAFATPHVLDARRCISYLTIELKGAIPAGLRGRMGNWVFGCDVCQDVCPYVRRFSAPTPWREFHPPSLDRAAPRLLDALAWTPGDFNRIYKGSAVKRAKWRGFMRNVCVAAGNWGDAAALPQLQRLADDADPLVAEHARWAIEQVAT